MPAFGYNYISNFRCSYGGLYSMYFYKVSLLKLFDAKVLRG